MAFCVCPVNVARLVCSEPAVYLRRLCCRTSSLLLPCMRARRLWIVQNLLALLLSLCPSDPLAGSPSTSPACAVYIHNALPAA